MGTFLFIIFLLTLGFIISNVFTRGRFDPVRMLAMIAPFMLIMFTLNMITNEVCIATTINNSIYENPLNSFLGCKPEEYKQETFMEETVKEDDKITEINIEANRWEEQQIKQKINDNNEYDYKNDYQSQLEEMYEYEDTTLNDDSALDLDWEI